MGRLRDALVRALSGLFACLVVAAFLYFAYLGVKDESRTGLQVGQLTDVDGFGGLSDAGVGSVESVVVQSRGTVYAYVRGRAARAEWDDFVRQNKLMRLTIKYDNVGGDMMNDRVVQSVPELTKELRFTADDDFVVGQGVDEDSGIKGAYSDRDGEFMLLAATPMPLKKWSRAGKRSNSEQK